jgi:ribosome maturation factor RimP
MNEIHQQERKLQRQVAGKVESRLPNVEVLAVELRGREQLCVYLDRGSGVDHALCEEVTGILRSYLAEYSLEVSSPGSERPLRTQRHFESALGRKVAVRTAHELAGRKRFRGEVLATDERSLTLALADGERVCVPYDEIIRGNLIDGGRER